MLERGLKKVILWKKSERVNEKTGKHLDTVSVLYCHSCGYKQSSVFDWQGEIIDCQQKKNTSWSNHLQFLSALLCHITNNFFIEIKVKDYTNDNGKLLYIIT